MAAEPLKAGSARSSYQQMGRKSQPWGATEIRCTRCGRRVSRASGHHYELQCGHALCELCLLITEECTTIICPDCEVSFTIFHDTNTTEEIDEALKTAHHNFEQLSIAGKILEHMQKQRREETESVIEVVEQQFDQLMALFDSRKKNLCEEFARTTDAYLSNLIKTKSCIEEKRNNLNAAMNIARALQLSPSLRTYCDLNQIIRTLKLTSDCELAQASSLKQRNPPRLIVNCSEIICMLKNMGKIEFEDSTKYHPQENEIRQNVQKKDNKKGLSCYNTSPPVEKKKIDMSVLTNEAPPPPLQPETNNVHLEAKNFQPQKDVVATASPETIALLPQMGSSPDVLIEEIIEDNIESSAELVFVSHVIDPCHFYIRKYSQIKDAKVLEKKVNEFCNRSSHLDPCDILELGARIFVNSIKNGMWCRGTITELIPIESKNIRKPCSPTKFFVHEVALIQIFMVDFGNSEVLIVTGVVDTHVRPEHSADQHTAVNDLCLVLRKSEPYIEGLLKDIQPLAQPCSLKDIVPQNSNEGWEQEAKVEFLKMVNNKAVLMKVFREEDGVLIVDLQKPPTNKISSDMPVSLRDALVFMELAKFQSQSLRSHFEKDTTLHYHPPILPEEMTDVSVMVCYINSPGDFYLHLVNAVDFLPLLKTVDEFYKNEDGENLEILCPVQDQACVAKFEDGIWYRAKVIGLPGHREVEVRYVDFGNTGKITMKDIRKIKDEFLNPPEKIVPLHSSLGDKVRLSQKKIASFSIFCDILLSPNFLNGFTEILEDNVLLVELFESPGAPEMTSINDQLVKEGLASYEIGYILKDNSEKHIDIWDPSPEEIISNEVNNLNPVSAKPLPNKNFQSLYNEELPVHICNVTSPEKIYVQWLLTENLLNSLEEKMIAAYENSKWEPVKWENDMHCAVKIQDKNQWRRGQIIRMVTDTLVEVLLYDVGVELRVNVDCLRKLEENLKTMGRLSLECSLVDIRPAGGSDKWTATACDFLSLYLTGAVATVILQENNTTWPLPVKIFCRDEKGERVDVSKYLIKKGLALRERRINKLDNSHSLSEKSLKVPLEQEDSVVINHIKTNFDPDKKAADIISEHKVSELQEKILEPRTTRCYKPPAIPNMKVFEARVSCVGDDGTIFVLPKPSEFELIKMTNEIQSNLKSLGLLEPYFWKKGEACAVRGSDTLWYRGKVMEVVGGTVRVSLILFCDCSEVKSSALGLDTQLRLKVILLNNTFFPTFILLFEMLGLFQKPRSDYDKKYEEEQWEIRFEELLLSETETPLLPPYLSSSLPPPGEELCAVQVKHIVSPNEVYICLDSIETCNQSHQHSDTDDSGVSGESESESLDEALQRRRFLLTDFRTDIDDGLWYRAKIVSIKEFNPLSILVQFVDYGSTAQLTLNRLRQIPSHLMQYPARAIKVFLAGFKPPLRDLGETRIPYCPKWSMEALWAMIDCLQGKQLYAASMVSVSTSQNYFKAISVPDLAHSNLFFVS
uniref:RING finger protein 17 n=1 Tax=Aotus nancymaae TaxID=37293 RepID=A0A2K5DU79_AOTNA